MAQALTKGPTSNPQYWEKSACSGCSAGNCRTCGPRIRKRHTHDAAANDIALWKPNNNSADEAILHERDALTARTKDTLRNTALATSGANSHDDNIIGAYFRYSPKPLYKFLDWSHEEAHDFMYAAKCLWKMDTESSNKWFDAGGKKTPTQLLSQQYRTYMSHGDGMCAVEYLDTRPAPFNTCMNIFDPLRCQTPPDLEESPFVRQGISVNRFNNPLGYFIYINHPYDSLSSPYADDKFHDSYKYVKARSDFGRPNLIHSYDQHFPHQTRGIPMFTAALKRLHMLDKWETQTLDAAIAQGTYAATIESDMPDAGLIAGAGGPMSQHSPSAQYFGEASQYLDKTNIYWDGVKVNRLYPGEKFTLHSPNQPIQGFDSFEWAMIRHVAASLGITPEELSGDYSKVNYNGARAGILNSWRHYQGQRERICVEMANIMVEAWMEEQITNGRLQLPAKIQRQYTTARQRLGYFIQNKQALVKCDWFGPGMGHLDPLKGTKAAEIEFGLGQLTGEKYQADVHGNDWDELQERLVYEDVIKAKSRKDARERAEDMGCLAEFEEMQAINSAAMSKVEQDIDAAALLTEGDGNAQEQEQEQEQQA